MPNKRTEVAGCRYTSPPQISGRIMTPHSNHDPAEIARFDQLAQRWWDEHGEFQPLHTMNPVRVGYIDQRVGLQGKRVLDVGCGGGLLCEAMTQRGAQVTGIDLGETTIEVATLHSLDSQLNIRYLRESAEQHAQTHTGSYDVVTCLEMLEHVPDPAAVIATIAQLLKPGGQAVFSTLNRNPKSYAMAILGAEYLLKMLPKGTHTYAQFIRPSELASWARAAGLTLHDITGLQFHPLTRACSLGPDVDVNYLMHVSKPL
ncbi:MAG: bifunctional 2-polyprenyl-6-hydroxyphenol methylase/3-demethylubiquinol 3-O-methyltransferase UbiG [Steroidobacteraceae bacterium]